MFRNCFHLLIFLLLLGCEENRPTRVVDGDPEPPMPGFFARNFTVEGVDSDKDGVIDDIEIWINNTIQDPNLRKAYKQFAKDNIESLKYVNDPVTSREWTYNVFNSQDCVHYFKRIVIESGDEQTLVHNRLIKRMFPFYNFSRKKLYHKRSENFSGSYVAASSRKKMGDHWQYCRFQISNFEYYNKLTKQKYPGAWD